MKRQLKNALKRTQRGLAKATISSTVNAVASLPGGEQQLAKAIAELSKGFPSHSEELITGKSAGGSLQNRLAHLLLVNSPNGPLQVADVAQSKGLENADFLEHIASKASKRGDHEAAAALRQRAVELEPKQAHRYVAAANSLLKVEADGVTRDPIVGLARGAVLPHLDTAIESLERALELAPGKAYLLHKLGMIYFEHRDPQAGLRYLEAATAKNPHVDWILDLATAYRRPHVARFDKALAAYEKAYRLNPKNAQALSGIINIGVRATLDWPRIWKSARALERKRKNSPYADPNLAKKFEALFSGSADAKAAQALLDSVEAKVKYGKLLHPETQRLVASRVQFLGLLAPGFRLHAQLAERRAERMLKEPVKDVEQLKQLMQSLVYIGDYAQAAELSDPRFWSQSAPEARKQLQKLYADAELMRGNAEPYLAYTQDSRRDLPLPGDDQMENLIRGKRVAFVGPAETDEKLGELIDSYDVIVRSNFNPEFIAQHQDTMGSRTDVAYYGSKDLGEKLADIEAAVESGELQMVVGRPMSFDALGGQSRSWLRFSRQEFSLYYHGFPLGVQRMAYDLLQFEPAEIALFNADFFTGGFTPGYRDSKDTVFGPGSLLNDLIVQHDLLFDFAFIRSLQATGIVTAHGKAARVLQKTPDEYIAALESPQALGKAQALSANQGLRPQVQPPEAQRHLDEARRLLELRQEGIARDSIMGLVTREVPSHEPQAVDELRRALEHAPGNAALLYELGELLFRIGEVDEGLHYLEAAVAKAPQGPWLRELASAYCQPHVARFDKAFEFFERAFQSDPKDLKALTGALKTGAQTSLDWPRLWRIARKLENQKKASPYNDVTLKRQINSLFLSPVPKRELPAQVLAGIKQFASRGRHLHPEVQALVANRVQFMGHMGKGYELYEQLAARKAKRLLQVPIDSVDRLLEMTQVLVYVGDYERAAQLSDPTFWGGLSEVEQQQVEKLHADAELMRGNAAPYIEYSRKARANDPLPGDEEMLNLLRGKRVAFVGPADTGDSFGELIETYDVVVRTRYLPEVVAENSESLGKRTDIAYFSGKDFDESLNRLEIAVRDGDLKMAVERPVSHTAFSRKKLDWMRFDRHEFALYYHGSPLGVQRILYDLLQFEPEEVALFNTDFFTGRFRAGYRDPKDTVFGPGSLLNDLIVHHDLMYDFKFVNSLRQTGLVKAYGKAADVLNETQDGYIERLESKDALGKAHYLGLSVIGDELTSKEAQERLAEALRLLEATTEDVIRDPILGLVRGESRSHRQEALEELYKALELAPGEPLLLFEIGRLLFELDQPEEGLTYMEAAVAKDPKGQWLRELAAKYRAPHVARFDKASSAYERALQNNPKDTRATAGIINVAVRAALDWPRVWFHARQLEARNEDSPYRDEAVAERLDKIFAPHFDDETAARAVEAIEGAAARGKNFHPEVLGLIATRFQFNGNLSTGYDFRAKLAREGAGTPAGTVAGLRRLMKSLVYLGDYDQAAALSQLRFWPGLDGLDLLKVEKYHADAELMRGNLVPYLEYSAQLRAHSPLPVDQRMEELIRGKRVAIVGPADTGDELGEVIDGYDVIVRPKLVTEFVKEKPELLGSRTDITYVSGYDLAHSLDTFKALIEEDQLKLLVGRPLSYYHFRAKNYPWLRFGRQEFSLHFHGLPLGVPRIAYDVLQFSPEEITIFNTDFYAGERAFAQGYREAKDDAFGPGSMLNDLIASHDLKFEFRFLKALQQSGVLTAQGRSAEVLELTPREYVKALEQGGALR